MLNLAFPVQRVCLRCSSVPINRQIIGRHFWIGGHGGELITRPRGAGTKSVPYLYRAADGRALVKRWTSVADAGLTPHQRLRATGYVPIVNKLHSHAG